jgi:hypothetical protein
MGFLAAGGSEIGVDLGAGTAVPVGEAGAASTVEVVSTRAAVGEAGTGVAVNQKNTYPFSVCCIASIKRE